LRKLRMGLAIGNGLTVVAMLLLLALEFVCIGLLVLLRFPAAGSVLIDVQQQHLLVVLGVALTGAQALSAIAADSAQRTAHIVK